MSSTTWEELPLESKLAGIQDLARIVLELSTLYFDRIGSIYFIPGVAPPQCFKLGPVSWRKHESSLRRQYCKYDRGPWRTSAEWIRAAVSDEIEFMDRIPQVAQTTYGWRCDGGERWRLAQDILPEIRDCVTGIMEDPLDRCAAGPFVLGHMDLNPSRVHVFVL
jgi:hypothetical protein